MMPLTQEIKLNDPTVVRHYYWSAVVLMNWGWGKEAK